MCEGTFAYSTLSHPTLGLCEHQVVVVFVGVLMNFFLAKDCKQKTNKKSICTLNNFITKADESLFFSKLRRPFTQQSKNSNRPEHLPTSNTSLLPPTSSAPVISLPSPLISPSAQWQYLQIQMLS